MIYDLNMIGPALAFAPVYAYLTPIIPVVIFGLLYMVFNSLKFKL